MNEPLPQAMLADASVAIQCPVCADEMVVEGGTDRVWIYLFELGDHVTLICDNGHRARIPDLVRTLKEARKRESARYYELEQEREQHA